MQPTTPSYSDSYYLNRFEDQETSLPESIHAVEMGIDTLKLHGFVLVQFFSQPSLSLKDQMEVAFAGSIIDAPWMVKGALEEAQELAFYTYAKTNEGDQCWRFGFPHVGDIVTSEHSHEDQACNEVRFRGWAFRDGDQPLVTLATKLTRAWPSAAAPPMRPTP